MKWNRNVSIFVLILLLIAAAGCFPPRKDGPYRGRVVDAETGKPIEGVVVLGVWYEEAMTPAGTVGKYYDAQETVTDAKGDFEILGQGWLFTDNIIRSLSEMHVMVFKAGYSHVGGGMWSSLSVDGGLMAKKIAWEGDRAIIQIRKLTMEERALSSTYPFLPTAAAPNEKMKMMLNEIQKERKERGLD